MQPAVEGVVDFQVAVGIDSSGDGTIFDNSSASDEWYGNNSSDAVVPPPSKLAPWTTLKQVRLSLMLQTLNNYPGSTTTLPSAFEDRPPASYPSSTSTSGATPRYRSIRMVVAPRAWNLSE